MKEYKNIHIKEGVVYQFADERLMVYVEDEGMIHVLNETAAKILRMIEGGDDTVEKLAGEMLRIYYGVDKDQLLGDVKNILNKMEEMDIIEGL